MSLDRGHVERGGCSKDVGIDQFRGLGEWFRRLLAPTDMVPGIVEACQVSKACGAVKEGCGAINRRVYGL